MLGGITTKLSEQTLASSTTISPTADLVNLTGSTAIATITPRQNGGFSSMIILVAKDGSLATTTAGNISVVVTMAQDRAVLLVYSAKNGVWAPGAIS